MGIERWLRAIACVAAFASTTALVQCGTRELGADSGPMTGAGSGTISSPGASAASGPPASGMGSHSERPGSSGTSGSSTGSSSSGATPGSGADSGSAVDSPSEGMWEGSADAPFDVFAESCYVGTQGQPSAMQATIGSLATSFPGVKFMAAEYSSSPRAVNDIFFNLPDRQGIGTFNWQPTTLWVRSGSTYAAGTDMPIYDQMKTDYAARL